MVPPPLCSQELFAALMNSSFYDSPLIGLSREGRSVHTWESIPHHQSPSKTTNQSTERLASSSEGRLRIEKAAQSFDSYIQSL
jgi:hypothetical protein